MTVARQLLPGAPAATATATRQGVGDLPPPAYSPHWPSSSAGGMRGEGDTEGGGDADEDERVETWSILLRL